MSAKVVIRRHFVTRIGEPVNAELECFGDGSDHDTLGGRLERHLLQMRQQLAKLDLLVLDVFDYVQASKVVAELRM